jgi:hypothetical protein
MAINKTISTINVDSVLDDGKTLVFNSTSGVFETGVCPSIGTLLYKAVISQAGTDAPTAAVAKNSLGGTVVWARTSEGIYTATLAGAFTLNKTIVHFTPEVGAGDAVSIYATRTSADVITLTVKDIAGAVTDLTSTNGSFISIEVYP